MAPPETLRLFGWCALALLVHVRLIWSRSIDGWHLLLCVVSALLNSICGGYGHNAVHRMEVASLLLDWNGLSAHEWLFEHIISHHPHVNTARDHDAVSMEPLLRWLPEREVAWLGDAQTSLFRHVIYAVGELVVAARGLFYHRLRWRVDESAPLWLRAGPLVFLARVGSHFCVAEPRVAGATLLVTMSAASYYFSFLAHLSHARGSACQRALLLRPSVSQHAEHTVPRWSLGPLP